MPYCPACKTEYREGFSVCADCGAALVETPVPLPEQAEEPEPPKVAMRPVFLTETADRIETAIVTDVLRQEGIPSFAQEKELGGYLKVYQGFSVYGEMIYVDESDLERAREVLDGLSLHGEAALAEDAAAEDPKEAAYEKSVRNKRAAKGWVVLLIMMGAAGGVALLVTAIINWMGI